LCLDEPTLQAQFKGQNLCYLFILLLACSKCHKQFNYEASQSNYWACLSAAGDEAEFMCFAFFDLKMLQFNSSLLAQTNYHNDIVRCLPESQLECEHGGMPPMATGALATTPHRYTHTPN
jgi:hypothetical protein